MSYLSGIKSVIEALAEAEDAAEVAVAAMIKSTSKTVAAFAAWSDAVAASAVTTMTADDDLVKAKAVAKAEDTALAAAKAATAAVAAAGIASEIATRNLGYTRS